MTSKRSAILVADIVGSARLYVHLGDDAAKELITDCLDGLARIVEGLEGSVEAKIGDEVVCRFDDAGKAAAASSEMQQSISQIVAESVRSDQAVFLSIGLHIGEVITDPFDMVAEPVTIARHLAEVAKAGQTLITQDILSELPGFYRAMTRYIDDEPWPSNGADRLMIHEMIWEVDGVTAAAPSAIPPPRAGTLRVVMHFEGREFIVDEARPFVTAGRGENNDIVATDDLVSHEHFRVELRHGRCTISDNSTNGTYLISARGITTPVRRETLPLKGEGHVHFGNAGDHTDFGIEFICE
jgi:adenylate cyclase